MAEIRIPYDRIPEDIRIRLQDISNEVLNPTKSMTSSSSTTTSSSSLSPATSSMQMSSTQVIPDLNLFQNRPISSSNEANALNILASTSDQSQYIVRDESSPIFTLSTPHKIINSQEIQHNFQRMSKNRTRFSNIQTSFYKSQGYEICNNNNDDNDEVERDEIDGGELDGGVVHACDIPKLNHNQTMTSSQFEVMDDSDIVRIFPEKGEDESFNRQNARMSNFGNLAKTRKSIYPTDDSGIVRIFPDVSSDNEDGNEIKDDSDKTIRKKMPFSEQRENILHVPENSKNYHNIQVPTDHEDVVDHMLPIFDKRQTHQHELTSSTPTKVSAEPFTSKSYISAKLPIEDISESELKSFLDSSQPEMRTNAMVRRIQRVKSRFSPYKDNNKHDNFYVSGNQKMSFNQKNTNSSQTNPNHQEFFSNNINNTPFIPELDEEKSHFNFYPESFQYHSLGFPQPQNVYTMQGNNDTGMTTPIKQKRNDETTPVKNLRKSPSTLSIFRRSPGGLPTPPETPKSKGDDDEEDVFTYDGITSGMSPFQNNMTSSKRRSLEHHRRNSDSMACLENRFKSQKSTFHKSPSPVSFPFSPTNKMAVLNVGEMQTTRKRLSFDNLDATCKTETSPQQPSPHQQVKSLNQNNQQHKFLQSSKINKVSSHSFAHDSDDNEDEIEMTTFQYNPFRNTSSTQTVGSQDISQISPHMLNQVSSDLNPEVRFDKFPLSNSFLWQSHGPEENKFEKFNLGSEIHKSFQSSFYGQLTPNKRQSKLLELEDRLISNYNLFSNTAMLHSETSQAANIHSNVQLQTPSTMNSPRVTSQKPTPNKSVQRMKAEESFKEFLSWKQAFAEKYSGSDEPEDVFHCLPPVQSLSVYNKRKRQQFDMDDEISETTESNKSERQSQTPTKSRQPIPSPKRVSCSCSLNHTGENNNMAFSVINSKPGLKPDNAIYRNIPPTSSCAATQPYHLFQQHYHNPQPHHHQHHHNLTHCSQQQNEERDRISRDPYSHYHSQSQLFSSPHSLFQSSSSSPSGQSTGFSPTPSSSASTTVTASSAPSTSSSSLSSEENCPCTIFFRDLLNIARFAYKKIQNSTNGDLSQLRQEMNHFNTTLKESMSLMNSIRSMCEHHNTVTPPDFNTQSTSTNMTSSHSTSTSSETNTDDAMMSSITALLCPPSFSTPSSSSSP